MTLVPLIASGLVHSLWQGALIGLACAAGCSLLHGAPAVVRLRLLGLGAVAMVALPVATVAAVHLAAAGPAVVWLPPWTGALVFAWTAGVAVSGARTSVDLLRILHIRRRALVPPPHLAAGFAALARAVGAPASARLRLIPGDGSPFATGILRPVVLFPVGVLTRLAPAQVEALLIHELVHLARLDPLWVVLQTALDALLFHHPAAWWLSARIRHERELAVDAEVAARVGALPYARALLDLAAGPGSPARRVVAAADGGTLRERVERILGQVPARPRAPWLVPSLAAVAALGLASGPSAVARAPSSASASASVTAAATLDPRPLLGPVQVAPRRAPLPPAPPAPLAPPAPPVDASTRIVVAPPPPPPPAAPPPPPDPAAGPGACVTLSAPRLGLVICAPPDQLDVVHAWTPRFFDLADRVAVQLASLEAYSEARWRAVGRRHRYSPVPDQLPADALRGDVSAALAAYEVQIERWLRDPDPLTRKVDPAVFPGRNPGRDWGLYTRLVSPETARRNAPYFWLGPQRP